MDFINNHKVVIYSLPGCPYCIKTFDEFKKMNVDFFVHEVKSNSELKDKLMSYTGQRTFPQIFINGKLIGGYSDLLMTCMTGRIHDVLGVWGDF